MAFNFRRTSAAVSSLLLCLSGFGPVARARNPARQNPQGKDEVLRVETEIVQTDVAVFDKSGRFVEGLRPEQFEVKVDGQVVPVSFFERVTAGSPREEAARAGRPAPAAAPPAAARGRGRHVAFFLDDVHLSPASVERTRRTVAQFFERGMAAGDRAMVGTVTRQAGFLEQFTDNRAVLRAALARVVHKPYTVRDAETVPMTEYQALRIDQGDRDALGYYATQLMKESSFRLPGGGTLGPPPGGPAGQRLPAGQTTAGLTRDKAERMVRERASLLLRQSANVSQATLAALENLIRSVAEVPGRKLVFFFSDGFYLNDRETGFSDRLRRITDAAARAGVVVYTLDARGLVGDTDASSNRADSGGQLARANVGELSASQDPLATLADETGGRARLNSFALGEAVARALEETANYYRLAWKPLAAESRGGKFRRVEVSVVGRPDLAVRAPRGYVTGAAAASEAKPDAKAASRAPEEELREALAAAVAKRSLPTLVSASFVDVPGAGPVLTSSVQVSTDGLDYGADGRQPAVVDVAGVVLNDQGRQAANFRTRLSVPPPAPEAPGPAGQGVIYNHRAPLAPGLYQVRAAARDTRGGLVGSASGWVEIPDLSKRQLTLSSLHLGGRAAGGDAAQAGGGAAPQVQFSVDHKFPRTSRLDFLVIVYNAARAAGAPIDLTAQLKIYSDGRAVVASQPGRLAAGDDPARVPFAGSVSLGQLPAGLYEMEVAVTDNAAKATATRRSAFEVR
jgi:VWFA-related protein